MMASHIRTSHSVTTNENLGAKLLETKMMKGPVLRRPVLDNLGNRRIEKAATAKDDKVDAGRLPLQKQNVLLKVARKPVEKQLSKKDAKPKEECMETEDNVHQLSVAFSSQRLNVEDIDAKDTGDTLLVPEYAKDIYMYMWEIEAKHTVRKKYLEGQEITGKMRAILIDWLIQVHVKFTLLQETLYLTVSIIDRYLQIQKTTKDKLQLVGVTAMFIASKYEEMYCPEIGDFVYITDRTYSMEEIRKMEVKILQTLNFYICYPLPLHFLRRNSKAGQVDAMEHTLAKFLMEICLQEYSMCHFRASEIAAAGLYLSLKLIGEDDEWNETLVHYSKYTEKELLPVVHIMAAVVVKSHTAKQQAVRYKYKSEKLMKISDLPELKPTSLVLQSFAEKAVYT